MGRCFGGVNDRKLHKHHLLDDPRLEEDDSWLEIRGGEFMKGIWCEVCVCVDDFARSMVSSRQTGTRSCRSSSPGKKMGLAAALHLYLRNQAQSASTQTKTKNLGRSNVGPRPT